MALNVQNEELKKIMTKEAFYRQSKNLIKIYGLEISGIITYLYSWKYYLIEKKGIGLDGWIFIEQTRLNDDLRIKRNRQLSIFKKLKEDGIISTKRAGKNYKNWYYIHEKTLTQLIKNGASSCKKTSQPPATISSSPIELEQYNKNNVIRTKEISKDISSSTIIPDDQLAAIRNIFNEYIITAKEINKDPSEIKLVIHKSIDIKIKYNTMTIKQLIYDKLQIYSAEELIQCIRNYKLICLDSEKYWFKPFHKNIMLLNYKNLNQLLNLDSLRINSDYYSELRNNMQFLTIDKFNPKSPLNTENSTYMGIDTEILKTRDINEYYSDIKIYIKSGIFEKNISYFQWLEELIICLIYRKDNEELLKELIKLHKYWYRHFKIMMKSDM